MDNGTAEAELCWDGEQFGFDVHRHEFDEQDHLVRPETRLCGCFTPGALWSYTDNLNRLVGRAAHRFSGLWDDYDARPRRIWLSPLWPGQKSHCEMMLWMQPHDMRVLKSAGGRIRFQTVEWTLELDPARGFSPVMSEFQTRLDEMPERHRALASPTMDACDVARDRHGVWYCRRVEESLWREGGGGDPSVKVFEVLEYDSDPPAERMRLTYETLGVPSGTRVDSTIPERKGRWLYGREEEGSTAEESARFREIGEELRSRGFASPRREDAP